MRSGVASCFTAVVAALSVTASGADRGRPQFTDVAGKSRISYRSRNDFSGRKYFQQPMCGGVGVLDYDQDGWMDLYFTNGAKLPELKKADPSFHSCLLRNKGDRTFEDVTVKAGLTGAHMDYSYGVAAGDYDNDGYPDLFIANTGRNTLYHNNRDGTFSDATGAAGLGEGSKPPRTLSVQAAFLDYDNDGRLDLVVSNYTLWTPESDQRCEKGGVDYYCHPKLYESVPHRLYHNLGKGKFEDVTEKSRFGKAPGKGMGIGVADFNQDGWLDIFIANDTERNFLYVNQGDGTFKEQGLQYGVAYNDDGATVSAMGCDVKDYDNDGWVDVFYNNLMGQIWALFRNNGGRSFRYVSPATRVANLSESLSGWSNAFIDYNNDGWKDIYSANGDVDYLVPNAAQHDTMYENRDGKTFIDVSAELGKDFLRTGYQRGSAVVDLNNDGAMDLVVTSLNQGPRILLNSADTGNHWLLVDVRGRGGARDAIGARVKLITARGRALYNHVSVSVGFMSSSDRRVHFGLGAEARIAALEVRWPGGKTVTVGDVKADQILKVEEPE